MKKTTLLLALALLMGMTASAADLQFNVSSSIGSAFRFDGTTDTFSFPDGVTGDDFFVGLQNSNWPGSVLGYTGDIESPVGGWTVGAGDPAPVGGGAGTMILYNVGGTAQLTGNLIWAAISSADETSGGLSGVLNYTDLNLVGVDANLAALEATGSATFIISFNILETTGLLPANTLVLDVMRAGNISTGSYSGTLISAQIPNDVPEPGTYAMLGAGLAGLALLRRRAVK